MELPLIRKYVKGAGYRFVKVKTPHSGLIISTPSNASQRIKFCRQMMRLICTCIARVYVNVNHSVRVCIQGTTSDFTILAPKLKEFQELYINKLSFHLMAGMVYKFSFRVIIIVKEGSQ